MARYFAPGEHITYDDFLSLRQELFGELEDYLHEKFNLFERVDSLCDSDGITAGRLDGLEQRTSALEKSVDADSDSSAIDSPRQPAVEITRPDGSVNRFAPADRVEHGRRTPGRITVWREGTRLAIYLPGEWVDYSTLTDRVSA